MLRGTAAIIEAVQPELPAGGFLRHESSCTLTAYKQETAFGKGRIQYENFGIRCRRARLQSGEESVPCRKECTLLVRGRWAEEIQKNGLRIKDKFSPRVSVSRIPVVTELAPEDRYDVIFVVLRYTQLDSILETLRANRTKNIVFVGNNSAPAMAGALFR